MLLKHIRPALVCLGIFTIITGIVYPLVVTLIAQAVFPAKANGSLITKMGKPAGSELIGQPFSDPKYFRSRPSATTPFAYNAGASTGSNYGPLNPALYDAVKTRVHDLKAADPQNPLPVPVDLVTTSASGLDPHISRAAAIYQASRVAHARGISEDTVRLLIGQFTEGRQLGFLGEARVNVLRLNLALDEVHSLPREK